jgi:hypothetical protein
MPVAYPKKFTNLGNRRELVKTVDIQYSPRIIYENCLDEKYAWCLTDSVQNLELGLNIELNKRKVDIRAKVQDLKLISIPLT